MLGQRGQVETGLDRKDPFMALMEASRPEQTSSDEINHSTVS